MATESAVQIDRTKLPPAGTPFAFYPTDGTTPPAPTPNPFRVSAFPNVIESEPNDDPRLVLLEILADHARHLRLKRFNVALCQYKDLAGGITEFPQNVEFLRRHGVEVWHADPRELCIANGEIRCRPWRALVVARSQTPKFTQK